MPDKFLTTIITDIAIMRANIDALPEDSARDLLESEFDAKYKKLQDAVPAHLRDKIDDMISEEIARHKNK
jgi:hypothetical protein